MQKFVPMLPTVTRENEGIAKRENKPHWLTHEQYVTFCNLRAHPRSQIRALVDALVDDLLPFELNSVHVLVKQLLFHVGEDDWKTDLTHSNGLAIISGEL